MNGRPGGDASAAGTHVTKRPLKQAVSLSAVGWRHQARWQHPPDHSWDRGSKSCRARRPWPLLTGSPAR